MNSDKGIPVMVEATDSKSRSELIHRDDRIIRKAVKDTVRLRLKYVSELMIELAKSKRKHVECIHHLRTETRRVDAGIRLFAGWLPEHRSESIRKRLSELRKYAGAVRDLDVLMPLLKQMGRELPQDVSRWLKEHAESLRVKKLRLLRRHCRSGIDREFERKMRTVTGSVRWRRLDRPPNLTQTCTVAIEHLTMQFGAAVESMNDDIQQLHQARILARRLRYTLDLVSSIDPSTQFESICRTLTRLQDTLGQTNDWQTLLEFLVQSHSSCDSEFIRQSLDSVISSQEDRLLTQMHVAIKLVVETCPDLQNDLAKLVAAINGSPD